MEQRPHKSITCRKAERKGAVSIRYRENPRRLRCTRESEAERKERRGRERRQHSEKCLQKTGGSARHRPAFPVCIAAIQMHKGGRGSRVDNGGETRRKREEEKRKRRDERPNIVTTLLFWLRSAVDRCRSHGHLQRRARQRSGAAGRVGRGSVAIEGLGREEDEDGRKRRTENRPLVSA